MKAFARSWLASVVLVAHPAPAADPLPAADKSPAVAARERFETLAQDLQNEHRKILAGSTGLYLKALADLGSQMQKKGDLDGVVAVRRELQRAQQKGSDTEPAFADEHPELLAVRATIAKEMAVAALDRDRKLVAMFVKYTNALNTLEKQLTQSAKVDQALEVRQEQLRVRSDIAVLQAMAAVAAASPPSVSRTPDTSPPAAPGPPVPVRRDLAAALDRIQVATFECSSYRQPIDHVNTLVQVLYPQGVKFRLEAPALGVSSVYFSPDGMPRYSARFLSSPSATRQPSFTMRDVSALEVLQAVCAVASLGYRLDEAQGEIVILDNSSPQAQWAFAPLTAELMARELGSFANYEKARAQYGQKKFLARGFVTSFGRSLDGFFIELDNNVRLEFSKDRRSLDRFEQAQKLYREGSKSSYSKVFVAGIGLLHPRFDAAHTVIQNCTLLYWGRSYTY